MKIFKFYKALDQWEDDLDNPNQYECSTLVLTVSPLLPCRGGHCVPVFIVTRPQSPTWRGPLHVASSGLPTPSFLAPLWYPYGALRPSWSSSIRRKRMDFLILIIAAGMSPWLICRYWFPAQISASSASIDQASNGRVPGFLQGKVSINLMRVLSLCLSNMLLIIMSQRIRTQLSFSSQREHDDSAWASYLWSRRWLCLYCLIMTRRTRILRVSHISVCPLCSALLSSPLLPPLT